MSGLNRVVPCTYFCARTVLALAFGAIFLLATTPAAQADTCRGRAFVDDLNLVQVGTSTVLVTSGDGETYDDIASVNLTGDIRINLCGTGALDGVIVHFGSCSGHNFAGCNFNPVMYMEFPSARDFHRARDFFPFAIPPDSSTGQSILQACNAVADSQRGAGADRNVGPTPFFVTLGVDTRRDAGQVGADPALGFDPIAHGIVEPDGFRPLNEYSKTAGVQFTVNVSCAALPSMIQAAPKPVSVNVSVEPKGEVCPKETEVTAWIYYDKPAVAQFRFKLDGELSGLYTRETVKVDRDHPGPVGAKGKGREDRYLVKETKTYHLDPGQHHFRIEVRGGPKSEVKTLRTECPPFKVTSAWLRYDVENKQTCPKEVEETATFRSTRPGKAPFEIKTQGGLVVHSGSAVFERKGKGYVAKVKRPNLVMNAFDQDMMALIKNDPAANSGWTRLKVECLEVLSGTLDLREFQATRCEGEAALSIRTNMPGDVPYQLDCTGGRSWSGVAQSQKTGPDTWLGVDTKRFDVKNNEQVNCALKTRAPMPVRNLALKGNKYACHKPTDAGGSSDLAPDPGRPDEPPPSRTLAGDFSFIDNSGTRCPRQGKALINFTTNQPQNVHYSLDCTHGSFSGVAQTAKSPKGGFIAPALVSFDIKQTTQANCALKTVAPGKPKTHTLKGHLFQCVATTGVPGAQDLTPDTRPDPRKPEGPGRIVVDPPRTPTPPRIACTGGRVSGGRCVCSRGFNAIQAGANAFRCVRIVTLPPIRTPGPRISTPQKKQPQILRLVTPAGKSTPARMPSSVR